MFCPHLEQVIMLKREEAAALGFDREPYDAHLDEYERGETTVRLARLFRELTQALRDLISRLRGANDRRVPDLATLHYPRSGQEAFATVAAADLGYDFEAGRLDVSVHPFTSGIGPGDVRITTRYDESDFTDAFFSVIHEAGHGVYHQGLPAEHWGLPVCQSASLGISESQSRLWENMVARSPAYWEHYFPLARTYFSALREVSLEDFVLHVNRVQPGPIRVRADEVTYNLHIIMRFELELALMRGSLAVRDLPQAWNEKTRQYLGLEPSSHSEGVLQDVHWSLGAIGYFPTYTLGNLYAGQIFAKIAEQGGYLGTSFSQGKLRPCLKWLQTNVYVQGRRFLPRELLRRVTGKDLDARYFVKYLQAKYAELYNL
jgi:carboxypeptidase Taq